MDNQQTEQKNNKIGIWLGIGIPAIVVLLIIFVILPATKDDEDATTNTGQTNTTTSTSPINSDSNVSVVDYIIEMDEYSYSPALIQIESGETIQVKLTNKGNMLHNFVIDELNVDSGLLSSGKEKTITITGGSAGSYPFYCSVGNHRQLGMEGNFIVK